MAWAEWEQLKTEAATRRSTGTQIDQLAAGDGGGSGGSDLIVRQDDLGAVGHEAYLLHTEFRAKADIAGRGSDKNGTGSTMQAAAALKGHNFTMGDGLSLTVEVWSTQVKSLLQACAHISNHLAYSKKLHAQDDASIAADLQRRDGSAVSVSALNDYFE
ncbi:hypothetical protein ACGFY7_25970 [Streptomyces prunicolor]|uniref:hypothetical protein n=1 Tax=Streptomyces prunicolor TaxID=67348 RepID=UPI00371A760F